MRLHRVTVIVRLSDVAAAKAWFIANVESDPDADPFEFGHELSETQDQTASHRWNSIAAPPATVADIIAEFDNVDRGTGNRLIFRMPVSRRTRPTGQQRDKAGILSETSYTEVLGAEISI